MSVVARIAETEETGEAPRVLAPWTYQNGELTNLEYERVILANWQFAGHITQLSEPGSFFTFDLWRDSVIVMKDKEGKLRAYQNACRHRGARLLSGSGTCQHRIACPYHGWSYHLDGRLAAVPSQKTFPGLDKSGLGLRELEIEVLHGLIFVRVDGKGGPSVAEMWGDMANELIPYRLEEMVLSGPVTREEWNVDWKIGVDNNLENYHVPVGHPGYHRMLDNRMEGDMNEYGVSYSKSFVKKTPSSNWTERMYQKYLPQSELGLDDDTTGTWLFFAVYPNIGINIYPDSLDIFQMLPAGEQKCVVHYPIFHRPRDNRAAKATQWLNSRINRKVSAEDRDLCKLVQQGLGNHNYEPGPLSEYEVALHDFHARIRKAVPVAGLDKAPAPGTVAEVNQRMLKA